MTSIPRLAFVCGCLMATLLHAQPTYHNGLIDGETWNAGGSPYLITGDLNVNRVTIQPGVEVRFMGNYVMEVKGILRANGTACQPVLITTNAGTHWSGVFFNGSGSGSCLTYARIEGSQSGGVRVFNSTPAFTNCVIAHNSSPCDGGGMHINNASGTVLLVGCTFSHNTAGGVCSGGALRLEQGTAVLRNCSLMYNGAWIGGAIFGSDYTELSMVNCIVRHNTGAALGLGYHASISAVNCAFINNANEAIDAGNRGSMTVLNSILYYNNGGAAQTSGSVSASYCAVQNGMPGTGKISDNPALCASNFSLFADSPCIDAGDPNAVYNDVCVTNLDCHPSARGTSRNDIGIYGGPGACLWPEECDTLAVTDPENQVSCLGGTAAFSVRATGGAPLSYQWYSAAGPLAGETSATLTLTNLESNDAGAYWVVVSNAQGSVTSGVANLVVNDACVSICMYAGLTITGQPGRQYELRYTTDLSNTNFAA